MTVLRNELEGQRAGTGDTNLVAPPIDTLSSVHFDAQLTRDDQPRVLIEVLAHHFGALAKDREPARDQQGATMAAKDEAP